jgi:hypothetical protein
MFDVNSVFDHLNRLGLGNAVTSKSDSDADGDYIQSLFPDLDFNVVVERIMSTKYYKKYLNDFTLDTYKFGIQEVIGGYRTLYSLIIKKEVFGTSISLLVKRIDFYDSFGNYMPALGSAMLKDMLALDKSNSEKFELTGSI